MHDMICDYHCDGILPACLPTLFMRPWCNNLMAFLPVKSKHQNVKISWVTSGIDWILIDSIAL